MRYSVRFEEGYDLYDERCESWLKINHPDVTVFNPSTASPPHNPQILEAEPESPMSSTQITPPSVASECSSSHSVPQGSHLLTNSQSPMSSNSSPTITVSPSSKQDRSTLGPQTPLTTAAKRRTPLSIEIIPCIYIYCYGL